jgi:hypothetical protein
MKFNFITASAVATGILFYVVATLSTFTPGQLRISGLSPIFIILLATTAGLIVIAIGYGSMVVVGGAASLGLGRFFARISKSKQVIQFLGDDKRSSATRVLEETYLIYTSILVYVLSIAIGWDLYNADAPKSSIFQPLVHALNAFASEPIANPVTRSVQFLPVVVLLVTLAGLVPSIALPYFRKFKITSVNGAPFHIALLSTFSTFIVGTSAVLTVLGLVYSVLWANKSPIYYHDFLLVMMGLSIHYSVGTWLGRDRAEAMISHRLGKSAGGENGVFLGTVDIKPGSGQSAG